MRKISAMKQCILVVLLLCIFIYSLIGMCVSASNAGVGVLNVSPSFSGIRFLQQEDTYRMYVTASDYNSWSDIYQIRVTLEDEGVEIHSFSFFQYENPSSYQERNEFVADSMGESLLVLEKCSYQHSTKKETVSDRCTLEVLFVYSSTWFTGLTVYLMDREGETVSMYFDHSTSEGVRDGNVIVFPGIDEPIAVEVHPLIINCVAIGAGLTGVLVILKKTQLLWFRRVGYEE